jgi:hypothetical protein
MTSPLRGIDDRQAKRHLRVALFHGGTAAVIEAPATSFGEAASFVINNRAPWQHSPLFHCWPMPSAS